MSLNSPNNGPVGNDNAPNSYLQFGQLREQIALRIANEIVMQLTNLKWPHNMLQDAQWVQPVEFMTTGIPRLIGYIQRAVRTASGRVILLKYEFVLFQPGLFQLIYTLRDPHKGQTPPPLRPGVNVFRFDSWYVGEKMLGITETPLPGSPAFSQIIEAAKRWILEFEKGLQFPDDSQAPEKAQDPPSESYMNLSQTTGGRDIRDVFQPPSSDTATPPTLALETPTPKKNEISPGISQMQYSALVRDILKALEAEDATGETGPRSLRVQRDRYVFNVELRPTMNENQEYESLIITIREVCNDKVNPISISTVSRPLKPGKSNPENITQVINNEINKFITNKENITPRSMSPNEQPRAQSNQ